MKEIPNNHFPWPFKNEYAVWGFDLLLTYPMTGALACVTYKTFDIMKGSLEQNNYSQVAINAVAALATVCLTLAMAREATYTTLAFTRNIASGIKRHL